MDDILDTLGIGDDIMDEPKYEEKKPYVNKKDKINMYDVEVIKPKEIDTTTFNKNGHSYMVHVFSGTEDMTEVKSTILKIANKLNEKGYVFRMDGGENDVITNDIMKLNNIKTEVYLPFKKFNEDISDKAILVNSHELPFRYAAQLYGGENFNKLKKGAKAVYSAKIMASLGLQCDNPIDFILCYSPDGREHLPNFRDKEKVDYAKLGSVSFYLKIANALSIPVYNFKSKESVISFINTYLKPKEEAKEDSVSYKSSENTNVELDLGM